jgi:hypothetical protein
MSNPLKLFNVYESVVALNTSLLLHLVVPPDDTQSAAIVSRYD